MPRPPRLSHPGLYYHVMARGNNKQRIFFSPGDCETYLGLVSEALAHFQFELHAYCLMPNHVHLLLYSKSISISQIMTWLHSQYAKWFNWKYNRIGHLFQGRFKSKPVLQEKYLREVSRYIHNNPVKAGLTRLPQDYSWSSMKEYLNPSSVSSFVTTGTLLALCGGSPRTLLDFTLANQDSGKEDDSDWPRKNHWYEPDNPPPPSNLQACPEARELIEQVAERFDVRAADLQSPKKRIHLSVPKAVTMLALRRRLHLSLGETASLLGIKHIQSVENSLRRLRKKMTDDVHLAELVHSLDLV